MRQGNAADVPLRREPYSGLLGHSKGGGRPMIEPLIRTENLSKTFGEAGGLFRRSKGSSVRAVDGVSFSINRGETVAVVGESGCGKSTMGRLLLRLIDATEGSVFFEGTDINSLSRSEMRQMRRKAQMVFQ